MLAAEAAEGAHQRHVADDVDHLAVDGGGLVGEVVMQRPAGGGEAEHQADHDAGDKRQAARHRQADGANQRDRRDRRRAGRQHVPDEHVLDGEDGVRGRGDAARQHAGQAIGEVARRMPGQMAEQVAPQVAGDADEGEIRDPARHPPQQIVGRDQRDEQEKRRPDAARLRFGQRVDQELHAVLGADRAGHGGEHRGQDDRMRHRPQPDIAKDEGKRTGGVTAKIVHAYRSPVANCAAPPQIRTQVTTPETRKRNVRPRKKVL